MLSTLFGVSAMLALLVLPCTMADCNSPVWGQYYSNPVVNNQNNSNPVTASPDNQVAAATWLYNLGTMFMVSDNTGATMTGGNLAHVPGWQIFPGYNEPITDFNTLSYNLTLGLMFYVSSNGKELWAVDKSMYDHSWSNSQQIYSNSAGIRWPRASIIGTDVWISVQNVDDLSITVVHTSDLITFSQVGVVSLSASGNVLKPKGQYTMFTGTVDGGSAQQLWFYWIDQVKSYPMISYATGYTNGVQLSQPQLVGDIPFYNSTSVTALAKPDLQQAILLRTGYATASSQQSVAAFTVIKLSSGPVVQYCDEATVTSTDSPYQMITNWAPALVASIYPDDVSLTWVSSVDSTVNALFGHPWA